MIKGVGHVAIVVDDFDKSMQFYQDVLGFSHVRTYHRPDGARIIDLSLDPRQLGEVQLIEYPPSSLSPWVNRRHQVGVEHVGLLIDDMDATYNDLQRNGVNDFVQKPTPPSPTGLRVARFYGPNNELLELITFAKR